MENMRDDEMEIDLREIFYALKKKALLLIVVGLLFGCLSRAYTKFFVTPMYTSTSSMLVLTKETTLSSLADLPDLKRHDWLSVRYSLLSTDFPSVNLPGKKELFPSSIPAYWADFRSLITLVDVSAVAALPAKRRLTLEGSVFAQIFKQL